MFFLTYILLLLSLLCFILLIFSITRSRSGHLRVENLNFSIFIIWQCVSSSNREISTNFFVYSVLFYVSMFYKFCLTNNLPMKTKIQKFGILFYTYVCLLYVFFTLFFFSFLFVKLIGCGLNKWLYSVTKSIRPNEEWLILKFTLKAF